jgi:hypothetical protein
VRAEWPIAKARRNLIHSHPWFHGIVQLTSRPRWGGQRVAAAQFLLVRMGRATAPRGRMDPMGREGPAKPHRSPLSGLHLEGAQLGPATAIAAGTGLRTPLAWSGCPAPRFTCNMALIVALSNNCVVALRLGRRQARTSSQLPPADRRLAVYGAGTFFSRRSLRTSRSIALSRASATCAFLTTELSSSSVGWGQKDHPANLRRRDALVFIAAITSSFLPRPPATLSPARSWRKVVLRPRRYQRPPRVWCLNRKAG